jgi:hypothetical protein
MSNHTPGPWRTDKPVAQATSEAVGISSYV